MKSITSTLEKLPCGKLMAGLVGGRTGERRSPNLENGPGSAYAALQ
jgi:hypothetical protein